jgi:uncharacterized repeat protein (TIGR03803 family)
MCRKSFWLAVVRASLIAGLTLSICAAAWAAGREKAQFDFQGNPARHPAGSLVFDSQGNLYGTTQGETVFQFTPNPKGGWSYTQLYAFSGGLDGFMPSAGVVVDGAGNLYGTTSGGGTNADGVVFELTPAVVAILSARS